MDAKERILTIRLMEKLRAYPGYAKVLGLEIVRRLPPAGQKEKGE